MNSGRRNAIKMIPLSGAMRARFEQLAPVVLAKRGSGINPGHLGEITQWLLLGVIGLLTLYRSDTGSNAVLLLFLVGLYAGIVAECLVYLVARTAVRAHMDRISDERFVWAVVTALSNGEQSIPEHATLRTTAGVGVLIDLLFGLICGVAWWIWFRQADIDIWLMLHDPALRMPLMVVLLSPVLAAMASLLALARGGDGSIKAGGRGLALFAMTLTLIASSSEGNASHTVMLVINLLALLIAALSAFGTFLAHRETQWLKRYLQRKTGT